jgi:hypothetical protein
VGREDGLGLLARKRPLVSWRWAPGSVSMTEDGDCGSGEDSEERADRIASDRDIDGPQVARPVAASLDRDRRGAAGSVDPVKCAAGGFLCSVAALNNVRTGVAHQAHLLEMGLGGSALATRSPSVIAWTRDQRRLRGTPIRRR